MITNSNILVHERFGLPGKQTLHLAHSLRTSLLIFESSPESDALVPFKMFEMDLRGWGGGVGGGSEGLEEGW